MSSLQLARRRRRAHLQKKQAVDQKVVSGDTKAGGPERALAKVLSRALGADCWRGSFLHSLTYPSRA